MDSYFVDTNLFLRYLTNDVPDQAQAVERLLLQAEAGKLELYTSVLTIAEIVWTLESYYGMAKDQVRDRVVGILNTPGLKVEGSELIARTMLLYVDGNIDFVDSYNGLWMQDHDVLDAITFDTKHFDRIPGITARTPQDFD